MNLKLRKYTRRPIFKCKNAAVYSCGAAFLCDWVLMLEGNDKQVQKKEIDSLYEKSLMDKLSKYRADSKQRKSKAK